MTTITAWFGLFYLSVTIALSAFICDLFRLTAVFPTSGIGDLRPEASDRIGTTTNSWDAHVTERCIMLRHAIHMPARRDRTSHPSLNGSAVRTASYRARSSLDLITSYPSTPAHAWGFLRTSFFVMILSFLSSVFPEIAIWDTLFVGSSFSFPVPLSSRKKSVIQCYVLFYILRRWLDL